LGFLSCVRPFERVNSRGQRRETIITLLPVPSRVVARHHRARRASIRVELGPDLIAPSIRSRARASRVARTGCHFIANFLYALRISFSSASREMPSAA
jgi:hypothetical protein